MSYLQDKRIDQRNNRNKKGNWLNTIIGVFIVLVLFFFRAGIFHVFSFVAHTALRPVLVVGNGIGSKFSGLGYWLSSKKSLQDENDNLKIELSEDNATMSNYNSIVDDETQMKEILGRKDPKMDMVLGAILEKPDQSPYDTIIIDAGGHDGLTVGSRVFAQGNVPIGRIAEVYLFSSKVILFSNPDEHTEGMITGQKTSIDVIGRGGGNFEIDLPKDFTPDKGTEVTLPGINSYVLGTVQTIISDPRDSFVKALLASPINIQALKFVEVEK